MKSEQAIKRGAVCTTPIGLGGFAGNILAGAVASLLTRGALSTCGRQKTKCPSLLVTAIVALGLLVPQALAIVGGWVDENNTYPNVGAVVFAPQGSVPRPEFSGTLIHPRVFLTVAHTVVLFEQKFPGFTNCYVSFAPDARQRDALLESEIEAVIAHPGYVLNWGLHHDDVGVIILKKPIYGLPLAKLAGEGSLDDLRAKGLLREPGQGGASFTVAGYGSTLVWPPPVYTLGEGPRRFAQTQFLALRNGFLVTEQNIAGGTGYGDSGGPTFWVDTDGSLVLVALTSGGGLILGTNMPWRVDIPETLDFIDWVINTVLPTLP